MQAAFEIQMDVQNPDRVGETLEITLSYESELNTFQVQKNLEEWANGAAINGEITEL